MEIKIDTGQGVACKNTSGCTYLGTLGRATISIIIGAIKTQFLCAYTLSTIPNKLGISWC